MPDTYGVTSADIAAELPGLYPGGFSAGTRPTDAQVTAFITTADTVVGLRIVDDTGSAGAPSDKASVLARRYIIEWVKAQVTRIAYAGNDPVSVNAAAGPYDALAKSILESIDAMGEQAIGTGEAAPRLAVSELLPVREMIVSNRDLDRCSGRRSRF